MSTYKTRVRLKLQGTELEYYSPEDTETVIRQLKIVRPVFLQTFDGRCVIVNPDLVPAIEVEQVVYA